MKSAGGGRKRKRGEEDQDKAASRCKTANTAKPAQTRGDDDQASDEDDTEVEDKVVRRIYGGRTSAVDEDKSSHVAAELGLALPPASQRWGLTRLLSFVSQRHGAEGLGVRRALERLVLHVFVAAAAPLARAAAEGLAAVGVAMRRES